MEERIDVGRRLFPAVLEGRNCFQSIPPFGTLGNIVVDFFEHLRVTIALTTWDTSSLVGQISFKKTLFPWPSAPIGSVFHTSGQGVGENERRRCEVVGLDKWVNFCLKISVS